MRRIYLITLFLSMLSIESRAVLTPVTLYVYGFSYSFNDSTVYITDIMRLDSAWVDSRTKFLYSRSSYSFQLKNHLLEQGVNTPTCVISYATTRKKAEKKYVKLKSRYTARGQTFIVKYVPETDFVFSPVSAADDPAAITNNTKEGRKAAKEAAKAEKKTAKEERKAKKPDFPGGQPGGRKGRPSGPPPGGR
ncbi:MAG: hypothetical protein LUC22_04885 [Prevotella sp.]|nr:hypothetical protein [Prevotella sp.]